MKKKFYIILPIIAFSLILSNALFGHLFFSSPFDQDINKYSIYVHLQNEWKSSPGNILFDVTTVWTNLEQKGSLHDVYYDPEITIEEFKNYNFNQLQNQRGKSFVELKHEFSDCNESWKPASYRYLIDSVRNRIEFYQGMELNGDPYASIYPIIPNENYQLAEQKSKLETGYVQFIPICTALNSTTFEYSVKINDNNIGFDVYFVPSQKEISNYLKDNNEFNYYQDDGCFGKNYHSFNGICENVSKNSGLMITFPDELEFALTKINVNLQEKS